MLLESSAALECRASSGKDSRAWAKRVGDIGAASEDMVDYFVMRFGGSWSRLSRVCQFKRIGGSGRHMYLTWWWPEHPRFRRRFDAKVECMKVKSMMSIICLYLINLEFSRVGAVERLF